MNDAATCPPLPSDGVPHQIWWDNYGQPDGDCGCIDCKVARQVEVERRALLAERVAEQLMPLQVKTNKSPPPRRGRRMR